MTKHVALVVLYLSLLYLSRRQLVRELGHLVRRLGGGHRIFTAVWAVLFLPGTFVHEMSHFLAALVTGTKIGQIEFLPTLPQDTLNLDKNHSDTISLGVVKTQKL